MSSFGDSTKFALRTSPLRTEPARFGRRSPLRIGFDEPTAVEASDEFRRNVRANRPLPCRDRPGNRRFAASESFQFFALISSFSVGFDGFDESGAFFNNAPECAGPRSLIS